MAQAPQSDELGIVTAVGPQTRDNNDAVLSSSVVPLLLRALVGEKLKQLREEVGPHVAHSVTFFDRVNFPSSGMTRPCWIPRTGLEQALAAWNSADG